jgi:hypothetical protein
VTTIVFVHGTGGRSKHVDSTVARIRAGLGGTVDVVGCMWGDVLGAKLIRGGLSFPGATSRRGTETAEEMDDVATWALLELDPLVELRLLAATVSGGPTELVPGTATATATLTAAAIRLAAAPELVDALSAAGLDGTFATAVEHVLSAEPTSQALGVAPAGALPGTLARAFVAEATNLADEACGGPIALDGAHRDAVVSFVTQLLGGTGRGIGSRLGAVAGRIALGLGASRPIERRRDALTRAVTPFAGDILVYLARGELIRQQIEDTVRSTPGPVLLLAHSLGGIACVDTLVSRSLDTVHTLVTVGSQVGYLYEIGALPSLTADDPLPASFTARWHNIYDPRDLLSHVASGLFPGRVEDHELRNGAPFPRSHSAYFGNDALYDLLRELI